MTNFKISSVQSITYSDQNPGTSGLRKKCQVFMQPHYTENFIQSILDCISLEEKKSSRCLIVGGDGRFYSDIINQTVFQIAAANGIRNFIYAKNGILSTPAASALIRKHHAIGAIILTASHNPAGIDGDFGIKFNASNGGPAPDHIMKRIYEISKELTGYKTVESLSLSLNEVKQYKFEIRNEANDIFEVKVSVIDGVDEYVEMIRSCFDLYGIRKCIKSGLDSHSLLKIRIDCLNGVTGPYAKRIFCDILGVCPTDVVNSEPLTDFGGLHPDPNLTYTKDLVDFMKSHSYDIGAAFDGDGDRNMIIGKEGFFLTPSDSVAIVAKHAASVIPYFKKNPLLGVARSMPTSRALDRVASKMDVGHYEVPTGWKYFGYLMDANKLSICGEESFGMGCNLIREKDGIWSVLAWLSIVAYLKLPIHQIVQDHWKLFGRDYYQRLDFEDLSYEQGISVMDNLIKMIEDSQSIIDKPVDDKTYPEFIIESLDNFSYVDPIDGSRAKNQGIRIFFKNNARIVYRLSGTGSSGATLRVYVEKYETKLDAILDESQVYLKDLSTIAMNIANIQQLTGRNEPTVIT